MPARAIFGSVVDFMAGILSIEKDLDDQEALRLKLDDNARLTVVYAKFEGQLAKLLQRYS